MVISLGAGTGTTVAQGDTGPSVEASDGNLVTIRTKEASIRDLLTMLSQAADIAIIFGDDIEGAVNLNLPEVTVDQALEAVIAQSGYYLNKMPGDIYVVSKEPLRVPEIGPDEVRVPEPVGPLPEVEQPEAGPPPQIAPGEVPLDPDLAYSPEVVVPGPTAPRPVPPARKLVIQPIALQYADPAQVALMFGGTVAASSSSIFVQDQQFRPGRHSRGGGWQLRSPARSPAGYFGGQSPASTRGPSFAENFGQLGGALGGGGGMFGGGGGMLGGGGGLGGGGLGGGGGGGFSSLLPDDLEPPVAFLDDNALIVRGTADAIDQFREIVALLDKPAKQVEVSVKFISITTTFEEAFGIDWAIKNTRIQVFNQGFAPPQAINSVVRFATANLDAQLNALVKSSRATVINEPRVAVTNNMFASVEFSTEIPFFAANVSFNQFGQRTVDFTPDFVPVENYLDVMPRVNADDSVTLMLMPNISNVAGFVEGPNGERIPITTYQNVFTQLTVKDGETAVIGGLITKDDSTTKLHTPLLSRIPIIGKLFDSRAKNLNDTELLIFVTPRILRDITVD